ncbi:hypothetical protein JCM1840_003663 [Sporobolomyces johnsonii]
MHSERPSSPYQSSSASPTSRKRPISSPAPASAQKRANSEDLMDQSQLSDTEGSIGASRLNIASTPGSPSSDEEADTTLLADGAPASPPPDDDDDQPPAYDDELPTFGAGPTATPPPGDAQLDIIRELKSGELEDGDSWYLVSRVWYRRWMTACSGVAESKEDDTSLGVDQVGPIDNTPLVVDGELKKPVVEGVDVEVLPKQAWEILKSWYGVTGPEFERLVVSSGDPGSERIEFYPPTFRFFLLLPNDSSSTSPVSVPSLDPAPSIALPSSSPFQALKDFAASSFSLGRPIRLWRLPEAGDVVSATEGPAFVFADKLKETGVDLLECRDDLTLGDALLSDPETRIAVEQQKPDGTWLVDAEALAAALALASAPGISANSPAASTPALSSSASATSEKKGNKGLFSNGWSTGLHKSKTKDSAKSGPTASGSGSGNGGMFGAITGALTRSKSTNAKSGQRGLVGLQNLGNTCFMNSAIQCMSNTKELKDYFLSGAYKSELNPDNPLGMRGQVAEAFGQLIERMWHGTGSSVAPREFKQAVARFAPQFSGYGQQDSQELLAFLLDGTHEDLNRILKKPGTSAPDWEGGGDKELVEMAKVCWEQYRSRNDSVIVDLFQGQYRSTVVCPDCDKISITFDPFMYVTTNLPVNKKWTGKVYVVPIDPSRSVLEVHVEVPKTGSLKTLKNCVGKLTDLDPKRLVLTEEWHGKFFKAWNDDDMVNELTSNDKIIIYETTAPFPQPRPRKNQTPPTDPNAPILLVVTHRKLSGKSNSRPMFGTQSAGEQFGSPFILTLTSEEASTVAGIQRAVAKQYMRVTKLGSELLETVESEITELREVKEEPQEAAASSAPPALAPPVDASVPPTPPPEGDMDIDEAPSAEPSTASTSTTASPSASISSLPPPIPSTAPSTPARRSLFRMQVSKRKRNSNHLPLSQSDYNRDTEPLADRVAEAAAAADVATEDVDMFSPNAEPTEETKEEPTDSTPAAPRPLVQNGDFLVCEWEPAAHDYFFGPDANAFEVVEEVVDPAIRARRAQGKGVKPVITLDQCLTEFTKEERLGEDDMWYCSACKEHKQATKKVEIWKAPDVLVFALKRFSSGRYTRDKIDDLVDFPLEGFDMEPFVEGDKVEKRLAARMGEGQAPAISEPDSLVYDLYAVSNHFGGLGGGHYTAFAKNPENNKWYDFDDSRVTELHNPDRVKSPAAYLLFYRRRTARPIGGARSRELVESAIQSRAGSAAASEAGPSPFSSRENLASSLSTDEFFSSYNNPNRATATADGSDDEAHVNMPGRFSGMFSPPRSQRNSGAWSAMGSGAGSGDENEPPSPKSEVHDPDEWLSAPAEEGRRGEEGEEIPPVVGMGGIDQESPAQEIRLDGDREADGVRGGSELEKLD